MKYATIVADPPWAYKAALPPFSENFAHNTRPERHRGKALPLPYPSMTIDEIRSLPVRDLAARDAHLYVWTTNAYLERAFSVARAWGFKPTITLIWCKRPKGLVSGATYTIASEFVLFCRRGTLSSKTRTDRNWWEWPRAAHSQKPEHFLDMVEAVSPGPYLEMFSRRHRLGWDVWGNEVNSSVEVPA